MLVSCNMHFLATRKNIAFLYSCIPLATFLEEPFIPTNNSYRYMIFALVGWWFPCWLLYQVWRDQNIDHYLVHLLVRACWVGRHRIALSTVYGPWSATENYFVEYLTGVKTERAEILSEPSFYVLLDSREVASSKLKYFACNSKKVTVLDGPWSATRESTWECDSYLQKRIHRNISCISICLFLIQSCYKLILSAVTKLLKTLYVFEILRKQFL